MPIDSRIYLEQRGTQADIGGAFERGMRMGELFKAGQEKRAIKDAYAKNTVTGEDGKATFNRAGYLSDLGKINPEMAMKAEREYKQNDLDDLKAKVEKHKQVLSLIATSTDQGSYTANLKAAGEMGFDTSKMPPQHDPKYLASMERNLMGAKERAELELRDREVRVKEREAGGAGGAPKMTEAQSKSLGFGRRAMLADQMLERVQSDPNFDVTSLKTQARMMLPKWAGGIKDPREQALITSKLGFIASVLRKESGAAVTPEEFETYNKIYFPQPGDGEQATLDKRTMRQNFIDTEKMSAGPAWRDPIPLKTAPTKVANSDQAAKLKRMQELEAKARGQ